jgi:hypothetical protein
MYVLPRVFTPAELAILDGPAASPFVSIVYASHLAQRLIVYVDYGLCWRDRDLSGNILTMPLPAALST